MRGFEPEDILDDAENKEITRTDLAPFFYPSDDEINSVGVRGIYLANYHPWNQHENTKMIIEKYGFETFQTREETFNLYEKVEDFFNNTHNYLKYLKFGYGRATDHASMEVRHQRQKESPNPRRGYVVPEGQEQLGTLGARRPTRCYEPDNR